MWDSLKKNGEKTKKIYSPSVFRGTRGRDPSPSARPTTLGKGPCRPIYSDQPNIENPRRIKSLPRAPQPPNPPTSLRSAAPLPPRRRTPPLSSDPPRPSPPRRRTSTPSPQIRRRATSTPSPATTTLPGDLHSLPTAGSYSGRGGGGFLHYPPTAASTPSRCGRRRAPTPGAAVASSTPSPMATSTPSRCGRRRNPTLGAVVWTSMGPLPRWVPRPTTRWAPVTT
jgi:hypothetical protein